MHLVGFIIRIYHDARSPECQKVKFSCFICFLLLLCIFITGIVHVLGTKQALYSKMNRDVRPH